MLTNWQCYRQSGGDEAQEHQDSEHLDAVRYQQIAELNQDTSRARYLKEAHIK
jgi:hypothetical protein